LFFALNIAIFTLLYLQISFLTKSHISDYIIRAVTVFACVLGFIAKVKHRNMFFKKPSIFE